jgi:hypothetical protein
MRGSLADGIRRKKKVGRSMAAGGQAADESGNSASTFRIGSRDTPQWLGCEMGIQSHQDVASERENVNKRGEAETSAAFTCHAGERTLVRPPT